MDSLDSGGALGWPRTSRPRVNSAIDVAGFLSQVSSNRAGKNPRREIDGLREVDSRVLEPARSIGWRDFAATFPGVDAKRKARRVAAA